MTRKHFQDLANALRVNAPDSNARKAETDLFRNIVGGVASACKRSNPRFDLGRFEAAAGVVAVSAQ
jgi:hypothetical protein